MKTPESRVRTRKPAPPPDDNVSATPQFIEPPRGGKFVSKGGVNMHEAAANMVARSTGKVKPIGRVAKFYNEIERRSQPDEHTLANAAAPHNQYVDERMEVADQPGQHSGQPVPVTLPANTLAEQIRGLGNLVAGTEPPDPAQLYPSNPYPTNPYPADPYQQIPPPRQVATLPATKQLTQVMLIFKELRVEVAATDIIRTPEAILLVLPLNDYSFTPTPGQTLELFTPDMTAPLRVFYPGTGFTLPTLKMRLLAFMIGEPGNG